MHYYSIKSTTTKFIKLSSSYILTIKKYNRAYGKVEEYSFWLAGIHHCQYDGEDKNYYLNQKGPYNATC